jgi:phage gp29-like protein
MISHMGTAPTKLLPTIIPNPQHGASVDAFVKYFEHANKAIAKACLLPPTVLDVGDGGSFALAASQWKGPFMSYLDNLDRTWTDEVMQEQVLRPLIRLNFGPDAIVPQFKFNEWSKGDLVAIATMFTALYGIGFPLSKQDIAKTMGREIAEDEEDMLPKAQPAAPAPSPFSPFGDVSPEGAIEEGEQLDALYNAALARDLAATSQDPSGDDYIDTLRGNGDESKQYADEMIASVSERRG